MKQITKEITEYKFSLGTLVVESIFIYGMVSMGIDVWNWIV